MKKNAWFAGIIIITIVLIGAFIVIQYAQERNISDEHLGDVSYRVEDNIIILSWGEKPTGGYSIDIEDIKLEDGELSVYYRLSSPAPGEAVTQAITYPEDSAEIPGDYEEIHLKLME